MAIRYKTRAFVFKKDDRNESDRVFSVFTEDFGRLDIFGKAIRKNASKLRSGIDTFFTSEIEFIQGKNRKTLTDALALKKFNNITGDLGKFKIANGIGGILDSLISGEQKDEEIFDLLEESMERLNGSDTRMLIYYYFLWNMLSLLGYHSEVQECAGCHEALTPQGLNFSSKEGGVICKNCSTHGSGQKINADIVKILRLILKKDWQTLSKLKIELSSQKVFEKVSDSYYSYILSSHSDIIIK